MGLEQEPSEVRDVEVGKIESFDISKKFEPDTEEEVDVADAAEEQSPKRLVSLLELILAKIETWIVGSTKSNLFQDCLSCPGILSLLSSLFTTANLDNINSCLYRNIILRQWKN